jgi:2,5-diketo-D-gluconate reductase A
MVVRNITLEEKLMDSVQLNNGVKMPVSGFGVFQIEDRSEVARVVYDAISAGYRLLDTAQSYGNEDGVGDGIAAAIGDGLVSRDELFITTKVWLNAAGYDKARSSLDDSLRKLRLEHIDLVLIHQPFGDYYGTYRAMTELYRGGVIGAIGVSNFYPDRLVDMALHNEVVPSVNQIEVNPFNQQIEAEHWNSKYGVQLEAWAPFAEGRNKLFTDPTLLRIGMAHGKTVGQVVLRWLVQRGIVPLAKTTHIERMRENLNIFDFTLTDAEMMSIAGMDLGTSQFFDHRAPDKVEYVNNLH